MGLLVIWLLFGICACIVAANRGANGCLWLFLGVLLGPIGLALAFATGSRCPECATKVSNSARICPNCRYELKQSRGEGTRIATAAEQTKKCPYCAEMILAQAKKCRYCGEFLPNDMEETVCGPVVAQDQPALTEPAQQPVEQKPTKQGGITAAVIVLGAIAILVFGLIALSSSAGASPKAMAKQRAFAYIESRSEPGARLEFISSGVTQVATSGHYLVEGRVVAHRTNGSDGEYDFSITMALDARGNWTVAESSIRARN